MRNLFALLFVTALLSVGVLAVPEAVTIVDNASENGFVVVDEINAELSAETSMPSISMSEKEAIYRVERYYGLGLDNAYLGWILEDDIIIKSTFKYTVQA